MQLSRFPRLRVAHLPTPLEPLHRISASLGGPNLWIKRDDCTGLATGGNKTRKLEFLMADALERGADCVITLGATQSNHARQTAAFAAKLDLRCHLLIRDLGAEHDDHYRHNGNVLLDELHGATITLADADADMDAELAQLIERLVDDGMTPYVIPGGGSNEIGALGYVDAAAELLSQANDRALPIDHVILATGSAGTQAGLVVGLEAMNTSVSALGISVSTTKHEQEEKVLDLCRRTTEYMGLDGDLVAKDNVVVDSNYIGDGYGLPTEQMVEAVTMMARLEGVLLDPVYTGKAFAGLIDLIREGHFDPGENVVFLHTGGSAGLFAYPGVFGRGY